MEREIPISIGTTFCFKFTTLERETGFEPATFCLEGRHSTAELLPHDAVLILTGKGREVKGAGCD
jgi:hypothetical protein